MTGMNDRQSELDQLMATPKGALDQATAKVVNAVGGLMQRALSATGAAKQDVAKAMLVSPGRITQILAADGNVKVSTLARFMDACGYELKISAAPKHEGLPNLEPRRRGPRRDRVQSRPSPARFSVDSHFAPRDFLLGELGRGNQLMHTGLVVSDQMTANVVLWEMNGPAITNVKIGPGVIGLNRHVIVVPDVDVVGLPDEREVDA